MSNVLKSSNDDKIILLLDWFFVVVIDCKNVQVLYHRTLSPNHFNLLTRRQFIYYFFHLLLTIRSLFEYRFRCSYNAFLTIINISFTLPAIVQRLKTTTTTTTPLSSFTCQVCSVYTHTSISIEYLSSWQNDVVTLCYNPSTTYYRSGEAHIRRRYVC